MKVNIHNLQQRLSLTAMAQQEGEDLVASFKRHDDCLAVTGDLTRCDGLVRRQHGQAVA